jgi:predicted GIY-YIG superfamily endonuclease
MKSLIEIILNSDEYNDIKTITTGLSSLICTIFPRYLLPKYSDIEHSKCPGVYILYNEVSNGEQSIYIGEAENIYNRLKQHEKSFEKNFWTHTIIFQETNNKLNKAHYKNLEYLIYTLAIKSNRAAVINKTIPVKSSISIYDECLVENFLHNIKQILTTLNYKFLEPKIVGAFEEDLDVYYLHYRGAVGKLRVKNESEMILLKNSTCVYKKANELSESFSDLIKMRDKLIHDGDISFIDDTNLIRINKDIVFDSENEACAFVTLRNDIDGYYAWENANGYKIYEHKK